MAPLFALVISLNCFYGALLLLLLHRQLGSRVVVGVPEEGKRKHFLPLRQLHTSESLLCFNFLAASRICAHILTRYLSMRNNYLNVYTTKCAIKIIIMSLSPF